MQSSRSRGTLWALGATVLLAALALAGCNGEDIAAVAKREGLDGRWGIAVYQDPNVVDMDTVGQPPEDAEGYTLGVLISGLYEPMIPVPSTTAADLLNGLHTTRVLLLPEEEVGTMTAYLDATGQAAIQNFVASGGLLVDFAPTTSVSTLNAIFGFSLVSTTGPSPVPPMSWCLRMPLAS